MTPQLRLKLLLMHPHMAWRPVAYASRAMSETERHYTQIEKEALAITWACEKFRTYILGLSFTIETDHKPLSTKCLDSLPPRLIRFRLRLSSYSYNVRHVPGKLLYTADTLSMAPITGASPKSVIDEVEGFVSSTAIAALQASPNRLKVYCQAQIDDNTCRQIMEFCRTRWPSKEWAHCHLKPFWKVRGSFTICENILLFNSRIVVVPESLPWTSGYRTLSTEDEIFGVVARHH